MIIKFDTPRFNHTSKLICIFSILCSGFYFNFVFFLLNPVTVHSETYLTQPFSGQQTLQFRRDSALKGLFIQEYIELAPQFIFRKEKNLVEIGLGLKGVTL